MKNIYVFLILFFAISTNSFSQNINLLRCNTVGRPDGTQTQYNDIGYHINNSPSEYSGCQTTPAIIIAVIDSFCQPWDNCNHNFGQFNQFTLTGGSCNNNPVGFSNCRNRPEYYFIFHFNNPIHMDSLNSMLNSIPNDHYILAYTWYTDLYSTVPIFKTAFQNLGAVQITSMPDTVPYIFFIKKGDISTLQEVVGVSQNDTLILNANMSCNTTGVSELEFDGISIFPNPAADKLYISNMRERFNYEVFNVTGQMILSGDFKFDNDFIDLKNIANGFYVIRIKCGERFINRRFVKG